ncbi:MAG TPA: response regulator [Anaerolineae bacterium]|nr:response regulator [Anaerolineae bacterium]HXV99975.1 response regulator [Anaerolineae bacterium]
MNSNGCKLLIVDDEESVRTLLKLTFEKLKPDYQIVTAADGFTAMGRLMQQTFDLVLTDWHMVGVDGLELAAAIRDISPATRILLMTGKDVFQLRSAATALGLDGWLEKPFTPAQVLSLVEGVMDQTGQLEKV